MSTVSRHQQQSKKTKTGGNCDALQKWPPDALPVSLVFNRDALNASR